MTIHLSRTEATIVQVALEQHFKTSIIPSVCRAIIRIVEEIQSELASELSGIHKEAGKPD